MPDGPHRPVFKRGNRVGGHFGMHDEDSKKFKRLLDMWGISWLQVGRRRGGKTDITRLQEKLRRSWPSSTKLDA